MCRFAFALLVFLLPFTACGQYSWAWAKQATADTGSYGQAVTTSRSGSVYVTGGCVDLTLGTVSLPTSKIYLAKYTREGSLVWARGIGGTCLSAFPTSITTDQAGNVIIVGAFQQGTLSFTSSTLINPAPNTSSFYSFIAKFDSTGNNLWAYSFGSVNGFDIAYSVTTDNSNSIYLAGEMGSPALTVGPYNLSNIGSSGFDIILAKFSPSGEVMWAKNYGGIDGNGNEAVCVHADDFGRIILSGNFQSDSVAFDATTLIGSPLSGTHYNGFLVVMDTASHVLWAKSQPGGNWGNAWYNTTDKDGNIYVGGHHSSSGTSINSIPLSHAGASDIHLVKYDRDGNFQWVRCAGGSNADGLTRLACDTHGNIFLAGTYLSPSISFDLLSTVNKGKADGFIASYTAGGDIRYVESIGGTGDDLSNSVCISNSNEVYITGYFSRPSIYIGSFTLSTTVSYQMYLAKLITPETSIPNLKNNTGILSYPNPVLHTLHLNKPLCNTNRVELFSATGANVTNLCLINFENSFIDVSRLPGGNYLMVIDDQEASVITKL